MKPLDTTGYDTDKSGPYLRNYERWFAQLVDQPVKLLELGIYRGGSLRLWRDYFTRGTIAGLDRNPVSLEDSSGRIRIYTGEQQDVDLLDRIAGECAPDGFDIIIDDASHFGELTRISFWRLFTRHLKSGGLYIIEDWGTGYWESWPDGKAYEGPLRDAVEPPAETTGAVKRRFPSHDYGMAGFVKELVDEAGARSITNEQFGRPPLRDTRIERMEITPYQVLVVRK